MSSGINLFKHSNNTSPVSNNKQEQQNINLFNNKTNNNTINHSIINHNIKQSNLSTNLSTNIHNNNNTNRHEKNSNEQFTFQNILKNIHNNRKQTIKSFQKNIHKNKIINCLIYFDKDNKKSQQFKQNIINKTNLGMQYTQIDNKNIAQYSKDMDKIWLQIINHFCTLINTNQMVALSYLQRIITYKKLYKQIYRNLGGGFGSDVFRPNMDFIQTLFRRNQSNYTVDKTSDFFINSIQDMLELYYDEIKAMLEILRQLSCASKNRKVQNQFFIANFVQKGNVLASLWAKYQQFALGNNNLISNNKQFKNMLFNRNLNIFYTICKLTYAIIQKYYPSQKRVAIEGIQITDIVKFIDNDLTIIKKQILLQPSLEHSYQKFSTNILLCFFPFIVYNRSESIANRQEYFSQDNKQKLKTIVLQTENQCLWGLRALLVSMKQDNRSKSKHWKSILEQTGWNMRTIEWRYWLGIFLQYNDYEIISRDQILQYNIIALGKKCIEYETAIFWQQNNQFYHQSILNFMHKMVKQNKIKLILPMLIKSLGNQYHNYTDQVIKLISIDSIKQLAKQISNTLNLNQRYQSQNHIELLGKQYPVELIQQEIKFVCIFVSINTDRLYFIDQVLLGIHQLYAIGFHILAWLFDCLRKISQYDTSTTAKCVRYLIVALDRIFTYNQQNRQMFVYALGTVSHPQYTHDRQFLQVRSIVQICSLGDGRTEQYRQAYKLRQVIAHHIHNIIRLCVTFNEYFPYSSPSYLDKSYQQLAKAYHSENDEQILQWIENKYPFRSVQWVYQLCLILQNQILLPIELQIIRLLCYKMRVKVIQHIQFANCLVIKQILNQTTITKQILNILQPKINDYYKINYLNQINNYDYISYMGSIQYNIFQTGLKYQDRKYKFNKIRINQLQGKKNILGKINAALCLISTLLSLQKEDKYPLLKGINFVQELMEKCTIKNKLHNYQISVEASPLQGKKQQQFKVNINIIYAIACYLGFQKKIGCKSYSHPNKYRNTVTVIQGQQQQLQMGINISVNQMPNVNFSADSYDNVLTKHKDCFYGWDNSIGVSGVLNVLSNLMQLGHSRLVLNSLLHRNYPLNNIHEIPYNSDVVSVWILKLINMLSQSNLTINMKCYILQFLYFSIRSQAEYNQSLLNNLTTLRSALNELLKELKQQQIALLNKITLLTYEIIIRGVHRQDVVVEFLKYPYNLPLQILKKIIMMNKMSRIGKLYTGTNTYHNLQMHKDINQFTYYNCTIHLLLLICIHRIGYQQIYILEEIISLILKQTIYILTQPPSLTISPLIGKLSLHTHHNPQTYNSINLSVLIHDEQIFMNLLSTNPNNYGINYQYSIVDAYYRLGQIGNLNYQSINAEVMRLGGLNVRISAHHAHRAMLQCYNTLFICLLETGSFGYLLSNPEIDILLPMNCLAVKYNKQHLKNSLNGIELFGKTAQNKWRNIITLIRTLLSTLNDYHHEHPNHYYPTNHDSTLILISKLVQTLNLVVMNTYHPSSCLIQHRVLIQSLLTYNGKYISCSVRVEMLFLQSILRLNINGLQINPRVIDYYQVFFQIIQTIANILKNKAVKKLQQHIIQANISLVASLLTEILMSTNYNGTHSSIQSYKHLINQQLIQLQDILLSHIYQSTNTFDLLSISNLICNGIIKGYGEINFIQKQKFIHYLTNKIRNLSQQTIQIRICILQSLAKLSCFVGDICHRNLFQILQNHLSYIFNKLNNIQQQSTSLLFYVEIKSLFMLITTISIPTCWNHRSYIGVLEQLLLAVITQNCIQINVYKWSIDTKIQKQLNSIKIYQQNDKKIHKEQLQPIINNLSQYDTNQSLLQMISSFQLSELLQYYLQIIGYGLDYSQEFHNLHSKILNKNSHINELSLWQQLKTILTQTCQFYSELIQLKIYSPKIIEKFIHMYNYIGSQTSFGHQFNLINTYFVTINSKEDLNQHLINAVLALGSTIITVMKVWEKCDWKSNINWKPQRSNILQKYEQTHKKTYQIINNPSHNKIWNQIKVSIKEIQQSNARIQ